MGELENSLEIQLRENYDKLQSEECRKAVISYLDSHESVEGQELIFIKRLTKVLSHVITGPFDLSRLERIIKFNIEGAKTVLMHLKEGNTPMTYNVKNLVKIGSHFFGHAAETCKIAYHQEDEPEWLITAYTYYCSAGSASKMWDPKYSAYAFGQAGYVALKLACLAIEEKTAREWKEKAQESYQLFLAYLKTQADEKSILRAEKTDKTIKFMDFEIASSKIPLGEIKYPRGEY